MIKKNVTLDDIFESFYWNTSDKSKELFILNNLPYLQLDKNTLTELLYFAHMYYMDKLASLLIKKGADKTVIGTGIKSLGFSKFISENPNIPYSACYNVSANYIIRKIVEKLDIYDKLPPVISFVGSNGKGSTLNFLKYLFTEADYKVHVYTKPHVIRTNESMLIANKEIQDSVLYTNLHRAKEVYDELFKDPEFIKELNEKIKLDKLYGYEDLDLEKLCSSWFKFPAFLLACAKVPADVLLLEAYCGGEHDITNIFPVHDTIITKIFYSYDHRHMLGKNIEEMASTKARIVSEKSHVVISEQDENVFNIMKPLILQKNPALLFAQNQDDWSVRRISQNKFQFSGLGVNLCLDVPKSLLGEHQLTNAGTAIVYFISKGFCFSERMINKALSEATFLGRLQRLPKGKISKSFSKKVEFILDWGKNTQGLKQTKRFLESLPAKYTYTIASLDTDEQTIESFDIVDSFSNKVINIPWLYTTYTREVFRAKLKNNCIYHYSLSAALQFIKADMKKQKLKPQNTRIVITTLNTDSIGYIYIMNGHIRSKKMYKDNYFKKEDENKLKRHDFLYTYGHKTRIGYSE